jgi:hypothetical protein
MEYSGTVSWSHAGIENKIRGGGPMVMGNYIIGGETPTKA